MNLVQSLLNFLTPKVRPILQFLAAQGVSLAANLVYGLLCVRLLPTGDYAKFVVLFGVQGTLIVLADINFSNSLVPLIGDRVQNRQLIADYVASLRQMSYVLFPVVGTGLICVYPTLVRNQPWGWQTVTAMIVILLISTWFARVMATYGYVLILLQDRSSWYRGQIIQSVGTLVLLCLAWGLHMLGAFVAISINVSGIVFIALYYYLRSRRLLGVTGKGSREKRKAIFRLSLPNIPQSIFYALQGQISLFLITIFGHTVSVASVGALRRLGQIFALISPMNNMMIEPFFSKIPENRVKPNYIATVFIAVVACAGLVLFVFWFPEIFLWVLGPQYASLRFEVVLSVCSSAIAYLGGLLFCIHNARRFVYWWSNITSIVLIFVVQILFILNADLTTVRTVLLLNIGSNAASLFVNILSGIYGFIKGPRDAEPPTALSSLAEVPPDELLEMESLNR